MRWLTRRRALLALLALSLLALAGLEGLRYARAFLDLRDARAQVLKAADLLEERGLDLTPDELQEAEGWLERAREKLDSASGVLSSDPLLAAASRLPWLGRQVDTARALADIGARSSRIGLEAVEAIRTFQRVRDTQQGALSEKVLPILEAVEPSVTAMEEELAAVRRQRAEIGEGGLLGPLRSALSHLDRRLQSLESRLADYRQAERMAPLALGYERPQTYLVLAHDNSEIMASGGFILVYGLITFDRGRLERTFFDSVANIGHDWPPQGSGYIEPPKPLRTHLLVRGWPMSLAAASWWPDFPTAAQKAIEIYRANSGSREPIDGVIGINFLTLERMLEALGPVTVERYGETVTSENVTEKTLIITHSGSLRPWETDRYDFTGYLAEAVIRETMNAGPERWTDLLGALQDLGRQKNLLLYHTDPQVQEAIAELGWDGGIRAAKGDYLMVVDSNLRRNKINLVVEPRIDLRVSLDAAGNAANVATVRYRYDLSAWAEDKDTRLVQLATVGGRRSLYGNYLRLLVPQGSALRGVTLGGLPTEPEDLWIESGRKVIGRYFSVPPDASQELAFAYTVPSAAAVGENSYVYRLLVQKQPGTRAVPLTIGISVPAGMEILSVTLDGEELAGRPAEIATDLRQDRLLVVSYRPRR